MILLLVSDSCLHLQNWTREVRVWYKLDHPNVLPLKGFVWERDSVCPSLVTEWMANGSLEQYLQKMPNTDKLFVVRRLMMHRQELPRDNVKTYLDCRNNSWSSLSP